MTATTPSDVMIDTMTRTFDVAVLGNPNSGKSTIFNALTGLRQRVGNYAGVTVEKRTGTLITPAANQVRLHDLPGLYSLSPRSLDDKIAVKVLLGLQDQPKRLDAVVIVMDVSNLERSLYLYSQVLELEFPILIAFNMIDIARQQGNNIDLGQLQDQLGVPCVQTAANKRSGIPDLRQGLFDLLENTQQSAQPSLVSFENELSGVLSPVRSWLSSHSTLADTAQLPEAIRCVKSESSANLWIDSSDTDTAGSLRSEIEKAKAELAERSINIDILEAEKRYTRIREILATLSGSGARRGTNFSERLDRVLTHRVAGPFLFLLIFAVIFQSIFTWAELPMDLIEGGIGWIGAQVAQLMPSGWFQSLLVDGVISGVGAVLVFLPQILFLFFFLALLEHSGYMARVAFILDRLMRSAGLSGHSVIPLLSCFACAIPGVMATRSIPDWRQRLVTIMVAPLMSCSARLPVYTLMIAALVPAGTFLGVFSYAGITLLGMYLFGILGAAVVATVVHRFGKSKRVYAPFIMELPAYRLPSLRWIMMEMYERAKVFVMNAGKIILAISILLWFLASYPQVDGADGIPTSQQIENSFAGQFGHFIEPVIEPLGFDWKIGIGLMTSFAAREVLVATLGTIYNIEEADEESVPLREALRNEAHPETGEPRYTTLVAISIMVFFVFACQCMATLAVVKRETNSWRWPIIMFVYMTLLAYVASLIVYQGGLLLGFS